VTLQVGHIIALFSSVPESLCVFPRTYLHSSVVAPVLLQGHLD